MPVKISHNSEQVIGVKTDDPKTSTSNLAISRIATAQLHLESQIDVLNSDLVSLYERQKRGMITQEQDVELKVKKERKI